MTDTKPGRPAHTEHGEYGYAHKKKCKCAPCRKVLATYAKRLKYDHARGVRRMVPAGPVRNHLSQLIADGATIYQVESATGISRTVVRHIVWGKDGVNAAKRVHRKTADTLLAVTHEDLDLYPCYVPAVGMRRRIDALEYLGHTKQEVAALIGFSDKRVYQILEEDRVLTTTLAKIHAAYVALREVPALMTPRAKGIQHNAWYRDAKPWMCWDDESIDDPHAEPVGAACVVTDCGRPVHRLSVCDSHHYRLGPRGRERKNYPTAMRQLTTCPQRKAA